MRGAHGLVVEAREAGRGRTGERGGPWPRVGAGVAAAGAGLGVGQGVQGQRRRLGGGLVSGGGGSGGGEEGIYAAGAPAGVPKAAGVGVKEARPKGSHPNQYTKKRLEAEALAAAAGMGGMGPGSSASVGAGAGTALSRAGGSGAALPSGHGGGTGSHPLGLSAVEAVREKRRGGAFDPPSRASSVGVEDQVGRVGKRKVDELANANKRRKKA